MAASDKTLSDVPPRFRESKRKWLDKMEKEESHFNVPPSKKPRRRDSDEHTATASVIPLATSITGNTTSAGTTLSTNATNTLNIPSSSSVPTTSPSAQTNENTAPKPQATDSSPPAVLAGASAHSAPPATAKKVECRWPKCGYEFKDHADVAGHLKGAHRIGSSGTQWWKTCKWEGCSHELPEDISARAMVKHVVEKHFEKELAELTGVEWVEKGPRKKGKKRKAAVKKDVQAAAPEGVQQPKKRTRVPRGSVQASRSSPRLAGGVAAAASAEQ